uniref:Uncharacterized protein n=1 Tax=Arundo donax TaxID=35708 RepID=A0A0A9B370_ARUDO
MKGLLHRAQLEAQKSDDQHNSSN